MTKSNRLALIKAADKVVLARMAQAGRDKLVDDIIKAYDNNSLDNIDEDKELFGNVKIKLSAADKENHDEWLVATK